MDQPVLLPPLPIETLKGKSSVAQAIAALIREEIAAGRLPKNAKLPNEQELIKHFGVSRPSCREALRILQSEGLLVVSRGNNGGGRINHPKPEKIAANAAFLLRLRKATLKDTFEVRQLIEPSVVAKLARTPDKEVLKNLEQIIISQKYAIGDAVKFVDLEHKFRSLLLESCQNESLRLIGMILEEIINGQQAKVKVPEHKFEIPEEEYSVKIKLQLLAYIEKGDSEAAYNHWMDYICEYENGYVRHCGEEVLYIN